MRSQTPATECAQFVEVWPAIHWSKSKRRPILATSYNPKPCTTVTYLNAHSTVTTILARQFQKLHEHPMTLGRAKLQL